jgi:alkaline phosphatase D
MLDTRLEGRELQIDSIFSRALQDTNRTILGATQKAWLLAELSKSNARWKVIGQQVMFAEFNVGWAALGLNNPAFTFESLEGLFLDIWDGYPAERAQILRHIKRNKINNVVMLTGDLHTAFAYDVPEKPVNRSFIAFPGLGQVPNYQPDTSYNAITGKGSLAVEFMTPSVTSANFDENLGSIATAQTLQKQINTPIVPFPGVSLGNPNPHLKFVDLIQNGHFILDVKPDSVQANYYFSEVLRPINTEKFAEAWYTRNTENHLRKAALASSNKAQLDIPAPAQPPLATSLRGTKLKTSDFSLLGLYPNPFAQTNTLHYSLAKAAQLNISLYSTDGKLVKVLYNDKAIPGVYTTVLDGSTLAAGQYFYKILVNQEVITAKVIIKK